MSKICFISPSFINSKKRIRFAERSVRSLDDCMNKDYKLIVVDDTPNKRTSFWGKNYYKDVERIYDNPNIKLYRREGRGSTTAVLDALKLAKKDGAEYVFLHLDDNVYIPKLKNLVNFSVDAFERNPKLMEIRMSGRPIISDKCTENKGNLSVINVNNNKVSFSNVDLSPIKRNDYTLWSSPYKSNMIDGFWPIVLWSTVYRIDFLENLLNYSGMKRSTALGHVELFYKDKKNWNSFIKIFPGEIGYINMQFCGIEMQRNLNWKELINYPNNEVR